MPITLVTVSQDERQRILDLKAEGHSIEEIHRRTVRSREVIREVLAPVWGRGTPLRPLTMAEKAVIDRMHDRGFAKADIAMQTGRSPRTIAKHLNGRRSAIQQRYVEESQRLYRQGLSPRVIAAHLGIGYGTVRRYVDGITRSQGEHREAA